MLESNALDTFFTMYDNGLECAGLAAGKCVAVCCSVLQCVAVCCSDNGLECAGLAGGKNSE